MNELTNEEIILSGLSGDIEAGLPARKRAAQFSKLGASMFRKQMIERIPRLPSAMQKHLKEVTLLGQIFVKDPAGKQSIEQLLKSKGASVATFVLYVVGEGIEKKQTDFAAEVAAQAAAARG